MATFAGWDMYGGATITRVVDGGGAEWIGGCGKTNGVFGFYVFKNGVNVPILPFCTGRGSIEENGHWIAWDGSVYHTGTLPGFVPIPKADTSALEAEIDALHVQVATLTQAVASLPPSTTGPILRVAASSTTEGGEVQWEDGAGGVWFLDVSRGKFRLVQQAHGQAARVVQVWE